MPSGHFSPGWRSFTPIAGGTYAGKIHGGGGSWAVGVTKPPQGWDSTSVSGPLKSFPTATPADRETFGQKRSSASGSYFPLVIRSHVG